jgi:hypothetical protein
MSELTKIAAIFAKHLSDALLSAHYELAKLSKADTAPPLSQADGNQQLVGLNGAELTKRESYQKGDLVMVMLDGGILPAKVKISDVLEPSLYLGYFPRSPKKSAIKIREDQILGLDPNR